MSEDKILRSLRTLKGLTEKEAKGIIEIIRERKSMKKEEIVSLFQTKSISSTSNAYELIKRLQKKEVLFHIGDERYEAINPDLLVSHCKSNLAEMEEEIQGFDIEKEWLLISELENSRIIQKDNEIFHCLHNLKKEFDLSFRYANEDMEDDFWTEIKEQFNTEEICKGSHNCILFINTKKEPASGGVIVLSKTKNAKNQERYFGCMIFDPNLIKLFGTKLK